MKVAAIVAEYNPFHNGHAYHIRKCRELSGADYLIVVMSPEYVQRGEPALTDKWSRARCALMAGADLVLQLPVWNAVGSAEFFAQGAVAALDKLGVVDYISFGCESRTPELIGKAASFFARENEPELYKIRLKAALKAGRTFPEARAEAYLACMQSEALLQKASETDTGADGKKEQMRELLLSPNNILAMEYEKALLRMGSSIRPLPVCRIGPGYNDETVCGPYSSASAIRTELGRMLKTAGMRETIGIQERAVMQKKTIMQERAVMQKKTVMQDRAGIQKKSVMQETAGILENAVMTGMADIRDIIRVISDCMPVYTLESIAEGIRSGSLIFPEDMDMMLSLRLFDFCSGKLPFHFQDLDESLENRIRNLYPDYLGFEQFTSLLKSRQLTLTRVKRAVMHILLDIRTEDVDEYRAEGTAFYARVLGFRRSAGPLLSAIKKKSSLPLISSLAGWEKKLDHAGVKMMSSDLYAAGIYNAMVSLKSGIRAENEYRRQIVIID